MADEAARDKLFHFLEHTMSHHIPCSHPPSPDNIDTAPAFQAPPSSLIPSKTQDIARQVTAAAHAVQLHRHTSTCTKGMHAVDDENCRMANKEQQPGRTQAQQPILPTLEQAACDTAKYAREYATKADCSNTNTPLLHAAHAMSRPADTASQQTRTADTSSTQPCLLDPQQGRLFLRKLLNRAHASTTYPAPLTVLHNLGVGDHILSHSCVHHPYQPHMHHLLTQSGIALDEQQPQDQRVCAVLQPERSARLSQQRDDYTFRSGLDLLCPYFLMALYEKVRIGTASDADGHEPAELSQPQPPSRKRGRPAAHHVPFSSQHPQLHTHHLKRRTRIVCPQAICDLPPRPAADAPAAEREAYACFALGNFTSDRRRHVRQLQPGETWWCC
ncbi:hypothetical protein DUNSADRAFT_5621 [Dunaliella salina]|uniref:Encoded protein n=1 Tax=Dunaliella salina TaxID=3046 RepID=A0ABQ7GPX2_DUNSA|nr:hypothetical protein DUNSADRAFT_5621 [Dunaliella salina]|eukprot:KAF5836662.1 hypothetical protein DUNSADRAFT_5621 [Dunaliella salina]